MQISDHTVVSLHYTLREGTAEGEVIESSFEGDPLTFLFGVGSMLPGFESNLEGKKAGDDFAFGLEAAEAYGLIDETAIVQLPIETFMIDGRIATEILEPGRVIPMADAEGNRLMATIKEVGTEAVLVDFNHPMAGEDLYFTGTIQSVRQATPSEIEHGHVHGPGGHHH